MTRRGALKLF